MSKKNSEPYKAVIPDIVPVAHETQGAATGNDTILVVTGDARDAAATRGSNGAQPLDIEKLTVNVNLFVQQMGKVLENTPEKLGKFHFDEFEIHAEISAEGKIAMLGSGVQLGGGGGLRFVFRRSSENA